MKNSIIITILLLLSAATFSQSLLLSGETTKIDNTYTLDTIYVSSSREMKKSDIVPLNATSPVTVYILVEGKEWDESAQKYTPITLSMVVHEGSCILAHGPNHYAFTYNIQSTVGLRDGYYKIYFKEEWSSRVYVYPFYIKNDKFVLDL